jgi:hypothetical protein
VIEVCLCGSSIGVFLAWQQVVDRAATGRGLRFSEFEAAADGVLHEAHEQIDLGGAIVLAGMLELVANPAEGDEWLAKGPDKDAVFISLRPGVGICHLTGGQGPLTGGGDFAARFDVQSGVTLGGVAADDVEDRVLARSISGIGTGERPQLGDFRVGDDCGTVGDPSFGSDQVASAEATVLGHSFELG